MSWRELPLSELPIDVIDGDRGKNYPKQNEFHEKGYCVFLSATNVTKSGFKFDTVQFIDEQKDSALRKGKLSRNDVVLTTRGTIGNSAFFNESIPYENMRINSGMVILRVDQNKFYAPFLYSYLRSQLFLKKVDSIRSGAAQPQLPIRDLVTVKIPCPDISEQIRASEFISSYDDLIENNRRRIQLLEESARLLYQEWFVHLRFPGHEQVNITDGVPEGWTRLSVAECCEKPSYGYTASANQDAIGPKFLRITDIVPSSISWANVPYCEADEATTKKYQLGEGDIVVARTGATVGYAKRMPSLSEPVIYASYLVKFSPNKSIVDDLILGIFMESEQCKDFVRGNAGGAAQPNANAQILGGTKLLVPSELLQKEFRSNVAPLIEQKFLLEKQNTSLTKARDLLLPKLMSGELTI